jgi:hypothetical protein
LADAFFLLWVGIQGVLAGYDQKSNVVLSDSKERVYSLDEGVEEVPLGLYLVKGDMMCVAARSVPPSPRFLLFQRPPRSASFFLFQSSTPYDSAQKSRHVLIIPFFFPPFSSILIGEIDEERDRTIDLSTIRADPIAPIRY